MNFKITHGQINTNTHTQLYRETKKRKPTRALTVEPSTEISIFRTEMKKKEFKKI